MAWWDEECQEIIEKRKEKLVAFKRSKNLEDFIEYKRIKAMAKKIVKRKKREELHRFAASLNKNVSIKYVWRKMRILKKGWNTIDGKKWQTKNRVEEIEKTIEKLAPPWANNRKSYDKKEENDEEDFKLNKPLSRDEFERALRYTRNKSAPGRDGVRYAEVCT